MLMFVLAASVDRCCRLPSQAAFESHSSILRHASEVTRPVCASFLQRSAESHSRRTTYSSGHEQFPECVRQLNLACREFHPDLHRCACQCPGSGMTMFFPGQKPLPDGHGVHSLPPPPRMYVPSWQGRHWPASGDALVREAHVYDRVECRAIAAPRSPRPRAFANEKAQQAERARTLFFDEAEAGAVAAEELQTANTSSRESACQPTPSPPGAPCPLS